MALIRGNVYLGLSVCRFSIGYALPQKVGGVWPKRCMSFFIIFFFLLLYPSKPNFLTPDHFLGQEIHTFKWENG